MQSRLWRAAAGAWRRVLGAVAVVAIALGASSLPPSSAARADDEWQFSLTPYLWLAAIDVKADTSEGTIDTDSGFSDVFTDLNFGFMLAGEAHNNTYGLLVDLLYLSVTTEGDTPNQLLWDKAVATTSGFVGSFYGEYRVIDHEGLDLDLLAGMRLYTITVDASLKGGPARIVSDDASDTWVDPVFGLRGRYTFDEDFFVGVSGDVGGFGVGSELTYQVLGTVGWSFADDWALSAGYRYLFVDKDFDGQDIKFQIHGPVVGVTYRF